MVESLDQYFQVNKIPEENELPALLSLTGPVPYSLRYKVEAAPT